MTKTSYIISENFIERSDIGEFLIDHRVISDLYNIVMKAHVDTHVAGEKLGCRIFNLAYRICNIATNPVGTIDEVKQLLDSKARIALNFSASSVAWALLRLHEGLVYVSPEITPFLQNNCRKGGFYSCYQNFIRNYAGTFDTPINFSGVALPKEEKPVEKSLNEKFLDAQQAFIGRASQLIDRNKELENQLVAQEEKYTKELEVRQSKVNMLSGKLNQSRKEIEDLKEEVEMLRQKVANPRTVIKEVVRREVVEVPESKVFNSKALAKYAISLPKDEDAAFIATAMQDMCVRNRFFDTEVLDTIESIKKERERLRAEMEKKQLEAKAQFEGNQTTFNIQHVDQLNPSASDVHNLYEGRPMRRVLGEYLNKDRTRQSRSHYYDEVEEIMNERHGIYPIE